MRYQDAWARNGIPRQTLEDQEKLVLQDQGTVKTDQGTVSYDQTAGRLLPHHLRPSMDASAFAWSIPATWSRANGTTTLLVITQIQPITVIFTLAEDSLARCSPRCAAAAKLPVEAWDRQMSKKIATGQLETRGQPDRHHHRHRQAARHVRQSRQRAFPQPVRQHAPARPDPAEPDPHPVLRHPAQRRRRLRLRHSERQGHA